MLNILEYLLSKDKQKAICDDPEIGEIAYDQFGDDWYVEDFCSIIHEKRKLEQLISKYDETHFFQSWLDDDFDEYDWKRHYEVDDIYAVAVSVPKDCPKRLCNMTTAVYIWGQDDLYNTQRNPEKKWNTLK